MLFCGKSIFISNNEFAKHSFQIFQVIIFSCCRVVSRPKTIMLIVTLAGSRGKLGNIFNTATSCTAASTSSCGKFMIP
jgi:hypothetical protein